MYRIYNETFNPKDLQSFNGKYEKISIVFDTNFATSVLLVNASFKAVAGAIFIDCPNGSKFSTGIYNVKGIEDGEIKLTDGFIRFFIFNSEIKQKGENL